MYKLALQALPTLLSRIRQTQAVYAPMQFANQVNFMAWNKGDVVDLQTLKTVKSPKDVFFPQSETLYTCQTEHHKIKVIPQELQTQDFVLFGVKACDVRGIALLDTVFLVDPLDTFYAARRAHGTVVSLACNEPEETCFCTAFGIDPANPGADVTTWIVEQTLYWQAQTKKGETLTNSVLDLLEQVSDNAVDVAKENIQAIVQKLPYANLSLDGWGGDALNEKFNAPQWETLYKTCLACGTCTFVCPTCQCYDIKDYKGIGGVERYRCWDSCMYSDFTLMAHGNNRTTQLQRFRQRFMHKLVYFPDNHEGTYSCVGCGRCVEKCPASLNIVKVIKAFQTERSDCHES